MVRPKYLSYLDKEYEDFCGAVSDQEFITFVAEHVEWIAAEHFKQRPCIIKQRVSELGDQIVINKHKRRENTLIYKYGSVEAYYQQMREKQLQTFADRYGSVEAAWEAQKQTRTVTCMERYGVPSPIQDPEIQERAYQGKLKLFQDPANVQAMRAKQEATRIARYGSLEAAEQVRIAKRKQTLQEHPEISKKRVEKTAQTLQAQYGEGVTSQFKRKDHIRESVIAKYGSWEAACQVRVENMKQSCLQKYGVDNYGKLPEHATYLKENCGRWVGKTQETKRKHNSFHTSQPEESFYRFLCWLFGEEDVTRQYQDAERYPFACDFYVKSLDLFIELNFHWTHGKKPYDPNNTGCQEKLKVWQSKAQKSKFYKNAIRVWTDRDVLKLTSALQNSLYYYAFYSYQEAIDTIYQLCN